MRRVPVVWLLLYPTIKLQKRVDVSGEDDGDGAVVEERQPPRRPSRINYQTNQKYLGLNRTATERLNRALGPRPVARSTQRPLPNEALSHTHTRNTRLTSRQPKKILISSRRSSLLPQTIHEDPEGC